VSTSVEDHLNEIDGTKVEKYSGRSADRDEAIFDDVVVTGDTPILKELSTTIQEVSRRQ
jgi:hypothetical protein